LQYTAVGTATPTLSKRFLNGLSVDEVLGQEDLTQAIGAADRELWFVDDNEGTTRDLVDNSGNIAAPLHVHAVWPGPLGRHGPDELLVRRRHPRCPDRLAVQ
jgi:hypothetical protein